MAFVRKSKVDLWLDSIAQTEEPRASGQDESPVVWEGDDGPKKADKGDKSTHFQKFLDSLASVNAKEDDESKKPDDKYILKLIGTHEHWNEKEVDINRPTSWSNETTRAQWAQAKLENSTFGSPAPEADDPDFAIFHEQLEFFRNEFYTTHAHNHKVITSVATESKTDLLGCYQGLVADYRREGKETAARFFEESPFDYSMPMPMPTPIPNTEKKKPPTKEYNEPNLPPFVRAHTNPWCKHPKREVKRKKAIEKPAPGPTTAEIVADLEHYLAVDCGLGDVKGDLETDKDKDWSKNVSKDLDKDTDGLTKESAERKEPGTSQPDLVTLLLRLPDVRPTPLFELVDPPERFRDFYYLEDYSPERGFSTTIHYYNTSGNEDTEDLKEDSPKIDVAGPSGQQSGSSPLTTRTNRADLSAGRFKRY